MSWDEFPHFNVVLEERNGRLRKVLLVEMKMFDQGTVIYMFDSSE